MVLSSDIGNAGRIATGALGASTPIRYRRTRVGLM